MIRRSLLAGLGALLVPGLARAQTGPQPPLRKERIVIETRRGKRHSFTVEMAIQPAEQSIGLMFRPNVPADGGMLFDWIKPRKSQMWMRNTIASLDMIFIGEEGRIRTIVERTIPQSLAIIDSRVPVRATLEVAGGTCQRLGISVGDRVVHPIFEMQSP
ncbi:MAG: DUF192 domain-containing protein [Acetobacteraceae bacterium]|nr:DUF192 domain-containing protein [Acetobacteraceae bacterium]